MDPPLYILRPEAAITTKQVIYLWTWAWGTPEGNDFQMEYIINVKKVSSYSVNWDHRPRTHSS